MIQDSPYNEVLMSGEIPGAQSNEKRLALKASSNDDKFYIYSTKSGQPSGPNAHVVSTSDVKIDSFLGFLPEKGLALSKKPTGITSDFDATDKWAIWMTNWDPNGSMSLTIDNPIDLNIQWFTFSMIIPWNVVFSSSDTAIAFAFGADPLTGKPKVAQPGMADDGTPLYLGLDPEKTPEAVKTTVGEVFKFAGLAELTQVLPDALVKGSASLERNSAIGKRNAMWFSPEMQFHTSMRLRFVLDGTQDLEDMLINALPGLKFQEAAVVVKKSLSLCLTDLGPQAIPFGEIDFEIDCSVTASGQTASLLSGLKVFDSGLGLTIQVKSENQCSDPLAVIVSWLTDLLPDADLSSISDILLQGDLFTNHIHLRRLRIEFDTSEGQVELQSVGVDIEISTGSFGQGNDRSKRIPFLVSYTWNRDLDVQSSIQGQLWNYVAKLDDAILRPQFESFTHLQPITKDPADFIDLATLVPGESVENIPSILPTKITRAVIYLSSTTFFIGATLQSKNAGQSDQSTVPQLNLGEMNLEASFKWTEKASFSLGFAITTFLKPGKNSRHQETAMLAGTLKYSSDSKTWKLSAAIEDLYGSNLYELFDPDSADHVIPLIGSLEIAKVTLDYKYTNSVGSHFLLKGLIYIAALELDLAFEFKNKEGWTFKASLKSTDAKATIGGIISSILPSDDLELPSFLAETQMNGNDGGGMHLEVINSKGESGMFQFMTSIAISELELTFAQIHLAEWPDAVPSKRFIKVALVGLPQVSIPLIGDISQPFDEMFLMWVQDNTKKNKTMPGLTRQEIGDLNLSLTKHPLVPKDKFQTQSKTDVLITAGSHFAIVSKSQSGQRTCVLDYEFKKNTSTRSQSIEKKDAAKPDSDGSSSSAPFKRKVGPLTVSDIGLKFADKTLHIMLTATFELGPLAFSLIGFSLNLQINGLKNIQILLPSLEGLAVSFEKAPLTIAGLIRHGNDNGTEYYAGGLIIGWVPYQLQAAGFYGTAIPEGKGPEAAFTSVFVFARLDGPLVTLEFAEISGVTGGFGYNSEVRTPTPDQIVNFPFIKSTVLDGATEKAIDTLQRLTSPAANGWFSPLNDTYWAAAGMKIDAFQMISLDAVAVVQFGQSVIMGLFAVAEVDIPNANTSVKFAHVELGIAVVVDLDHGILKAEAQLSPKSYILHPSCQLTGGFALYYWFDAPHADRSLVGDFVFTLGGYHQAFKVPDGYPNPPRLAISWSLGSNLSITGQSYFAITPKVAMAGGRLHAAYHAGPITAWFDAFANFLINYDPFFFQAEAGICIGVSADLDLILIHKRLSIEVKADLTLWGPPLAGRVHVDLKVYKFDINFGDSGSKDRAVSLREFYALVLQASSQSKTNNGRSVKAAEVSQFLPRVVELEDDEDGYVAIEAAADDQPDENQGHTFLAQSGLMNDSDKPQRDPNQSWVVRGGTFSLVVGCKMAISTAEQKHLEGETISHIDYDREAIYAKPMKLVKPLSSTLELTITQDESKLVPEWGMDAFLKSVPRGLWAIYDGRSDPAKSGNHIGSLLDSEDSSMTLMMGIELRAPPPKMSEDKLQTFNILDATLESIPAARGFPPEKQALSDWDAVEPRGDVKEQYQEIHGKWKLPDWGTDGQTDFVSRWARVFNWDETLSKVAQIPSLMDKKFEQLYVNAPLFAN